MCVCLLYRVICVFSVFFFKQKTAYEMRISDWSADVCSSDLIGRAEIVVVAGMMMGVIMVMPMIIAMPVMVMPAHQEQRAGDIDREAQHRNQRGAREIDAHGIEEAEEGFARDPDREDARSSAEAKPVRSPTLPVPKR